MKKKTTDRLYRPVQLNVEVVLNKRVVADDSALESMQQDVGVMEKATQHAVTYAAQRTAG